MARTRASTGASTGADTVATERVEIVTRGERRRSYTPEEKARLLAETVEPGARVLEVAQRHGISPSLLHRWRREVEGRPPWKATRPLPRLVPLLVGAPAGASSPCATAAMNGATGATIEVVLSQILARQGVEVDRSTLAFWAGYGAAEVAPVVRRLKEIVLASARVFADETTVPVLDPGRGQTKTGWFWTVARDDRPWGGTDPPAVVCTYAPSRAHEHARTLLGGYRGILQCDGYGAYKSLAKPGAGPAAIAYCWSHVRRGFYDLARTGTAPVATEALQRIATLYAIEAEIRGKAPEVRRATRQARSRSLAEDLFAWFKAQLARLPGSSKTAEAIRYALNHRDGLEQFLHDGRIEVDTNTVERAARPVALSRKNALFAGSDEGAENWAAVASLIETCKMNSVDPQRYLADLLTRLVGGWPQARIDELMPWCWATAKSA